METSQDGDTKSGVNMNVSEELRETLERVSAMRREQEETQQRSYELQREWGWQS